MNYCRPHQGDFARLWKPLSEATIDLALVANVLHEVPDRVQLLREIARVLRPDGVVAVVEWRKEQTEMGPPLAERLTYVEVEAALRAAGYEGIEPFEVGPYHYGAKAKRVKAGDGANVRGKQQVGTKEQEDQTGNRGMISRRRLLGYLSAWAAGAAASPAVAWARPVGQSTSETPTVQTQLPDTREGALRSSREMLDSCVARGNWLSSDIPPRSLSGALVDCGARRLPEEKRAAAPNSLLQLLGATPLSQSRLGLHNWPMLEESEALDAGHFRFALSPHTAFVDDGRQRFLLFGNSSLVGSFRGRDYLEEVQRRMFDRAVWAMANGCQGTAVVELDRPLSPERVSRLVRALHEYGIRTITWGNEPNDPGAAWRDNLSELVKVFAAARDARKQYVLDDLEFSLPGMAYFGQGEYLQKLLGTFDALIPGWAGGSSKQLPFQRVVDHYYGPVEGFLQRLTLMRETMAKLGLNDLKFDLSEVGNPTTNPGEQPATDTQMAEGYIPQITSLAIGSGMMDRLYVYSLLDGDDRFSLARVDNGSLVPKPSYQAFVNMARLLSNLSSVSWSETGETMRVDGTRTDGIDFSVVWSKVSGRDVVLPVPAGRRVFDALGVETGQANPQQVALGPKSHPSMAGPVRILVARRT